MKKEISEKQLQHYKRILQNGLDNFIKATKSKKKDSRYNIIIFDWRSLISNKERIKFFAENVKNVCSLFGFGREFSEKLSYEDLIGRVAQRFAELDLAKHIIKEFNLNKSDIKVEKIVENNKSTCDFRLSNPISYFEAKYTKNIAIQNLSSCTKEALTQIKETMEKGNTNGSGVVWIFTYKSPNNLSSFQDEVMRIKKEYLSIGFNFKLNVQTYYPGLYGDATVI